MEDEDVQSSVGWLLHFLCHTQLGDLSEVQLGVSIKQELSYTSPEKKSWKLGARQLERPLICGVELCQRSGVVWTPRLLVLV